MSIQKLIKRLKNIHIAGFRLKFSYGHKHLHEDMWEQEKKTYEGLQKYKPKSNTKNQ